MLIVFIPYLPLTIALMLCSSASMSSNNAGVSSDVTCLPTTSDGELTPPQRTRVIWLILCIQQVFSFFQLSPPLLFGRLYVAATGCAHVEINGRVPQPNHCEY